ncbi:MAG TPA: methylated-DNA--[protein]-cysteine S-methyltransferase [Candidatus Eisenbacteria bacterium]
MAREVRPLYVTTHETPLGTVGLAATPVGLASLMLRVNAAGFTEYLRNSHGVMPVEDPQPFDRVRLFLDRYFAGKQIAFEGPWDLLVGTPFQRRVWATLLTIPYGEVRSYRWLAETVGHPGAYRAVGAANGANPVAVLVPCHRVVNHNGGLGGYSGGLDIKRWLLALERVPLAALTPQLRMESLVGHH